MAPSGFSQAFLEAARPKAILPLEDWASNVYLPRRSARPGPFIAWRYQQGILAAIGDKAFPRVSLIKAARVGYTRCLLAALAYWSSEKPAPMLLLMPTDDDCSRISRDEVGPMYAESPILKGLMDNKGMGWTSGSGDRDTLAAKYFKTGASLKIVASRSPRNLRSHDCQILLADEIDAMTVTAEGDPLELAIVRTTAHDNRKIIFGSTPTIDGVSNIQRAYDQSDKRIFQVPCPHCVEPFEMLWDHVGWPVGRPQEAYVVCPHCGCIIEETYKRAMVEAGEWLVTAPDVIGHAGFRLNALVSLFKNSGWGELAQKFHQAKNNPSLQMVFENTRLGKVSKLSIDAIDPLSLQARVEDFSLDNLPPEVLLLTCGVDVQNDRLEACFLGWSAIEQPFILGYKIIHGSTIEPKTWQALDRLLATKWHHPNGYDLPLEATAIDSGGTGTGAENRPQQVYNFCNPRLHRHIFAVKGVPGDGPIWTRSFTKKLGAPKLFLVRVNQGKVDVLERLAALPFLDAAGEPSLTDSGHGRNPAAFRFSNTLTGQFFEQVASERRFVKYLHNRPKIEFAMVSPGARTEALDATNYAYIVRQAANYVSMRARAQRRPAASPAPTQLPAKPRRTMADYARLCR